MLYLQPVRIADDMAIGRHVPTADHHATALTASGPAIDFCDDRHHRRCDSVNTGWASSAAAAGAAEQTARRSNSAGAGT